MTYGRVIAALLIALAAGGLVLLRVTGHLHGGVHVAREGDRFPDLPVYSMQNERVTIGGDSQGTVVYNVFASWCPPCNQEVPQIRSAAAVLERSGVRFVGIDQGETPQTVARFAAYNALSYPMFVDASSATNRLLGARVIPETLVVRNGVIVRVIVGPTTRAALEQAVRG
jgi:thiol-disulfide isomerase/thioredoxin